ncbi:MAG: hypothetical protein Q7T11_06850 [Deltaproteobacteria bacterium]|nr:hypothetical protein [Deltaproteobacteria bacterium]
MAFLKIRWLVLFLVLQGCSGATGGLGSDDGSGGGDDGTGTGTEDSGGGVEDSFQSGPVDIPITIAKATGGIDPSTVEFTEGSPNLTSPQLRSVLRQQTVSGTLSGCLIDRSLSETINAYDTEGSLQATAETSSGCFQFTGVSSGTRLTLAACGDDECGPPIIASISNAGKVHVIMTNITMEPTSRLAVSLLGKVAFCATDADGNDAIGMIEQAGELPAALLQVTDCAEIRIKGYTSDEKVVYRDNAQDKIYTVDTAGTTAEVASSADDVAFIRVRGTDIAYSPDADGIQVAVNGTAQTFNTSDSTLSYRVFDFIGDSTLLVAEAKLSGGSRVFQKSTSSSTEISEVDTAFYPASISCNADGLCFALIDDGLGIGNYNLGLYSTTYGFVPHIASRFLLNEQVCDTGAVYESDFGETLGNQIGFYKTSGELVYSSRFGTIPRCDPTNENHSFFLCDSEGTAQVCSFRPDFDSVTAGTATHLFFVAETAVNAGACTGAFSISTTDGFGTLTAVSSAITINLSVKGSNGAYYSTSDCSGSAITQTSIPSGSNQTSSFYFKAATAGTVYSYSTDAADVLTKAAWKILVR